MNYAVEFSSEFEKSMKKLKKKDKEMFYEFKTNLKILFSIQIVTRI
jgi:mRNA-degrading endonuclease RelE of RelBE toxin-antitoxin system